MTIYTELHEPRGSNIGGESSPSGPKKSALLHPAVSVSTDRSLMTAAISKSERFFGDIDPCKTPELLGLCFRSIELGDSGKKPNSVLFDSTFDSPVHG